MRVLVFIGQPMSQDAALGPALMRVLIFIGQPMSQLAPFGPALMRVFTFMLDAPAPEGWIGRARW